MPDYFVGKTKIFIRKQLLKILFDEFRETCSENVIIPIQKVVRGFLARQYLNKMMGDAKRDLHEARKREGFERSCMSLEDQTSLNQELIFRSDKGLQKKLYDAKQQRMREERTKQQQRKLNAVLMIQKHFRGFSQRRKSGIYLCERFCELSLQYRDEEMMQKALQKCKDVTSQKNNALLRGKHSKLISLYKKSIQNVILEIMNEKYVISSLSDAIQIRSLPLLSSAVQLAKDNNMNYLKEVYEANQIIYELENHRVLLNMLQDELSKCNTMSNFMKKYDIIQYLIMQSFQYDLHGEKIVIEASNRLQKIENLLKLRQSLRHALEICSPTKMIKTMKERAKYLRLFSENFLEEEALAIEKIMNMLRYKQTLLTPALQNYNSNSDVEQEENDDISLVDDDPVSLHSSAARSKSAEKAAVAAAASAEDLKRLNMHEIYHLVIHNNPHSNSSHSGSNNNNNEAIEGTDPSQDEKNGENSPSRHQKNNSNNDVFKTISTLSELSPQKIAQVNLKHFPDDKDFIYLPRFVREPLTRMRVAKNDQGRSVDFFFFLI
jgi:hypothetical protein